MKSEYTSVHGLYFDSRQYLVLVSDEMKSLLYFRPIHSDTPRELYSREGWR